MAKLIHCLFKYLRISNVDHNDYKYKIHYTNNMKNVSFNYVNKCKFTPFI